MFVDILNSSMLLSRGVFRGAIGAHPPPGSVKYMHGTVHPGRFNNLEIIYASWNITKSNDYWLMSDFKMDLV